jgi:hypothetical protein
MEIHDETVNRYMKVEKEWAPQRGPKAVSRDDVEKHLDIQSEYEAVKRMK